MDTYDRGEKYLKFQFLRKLKHVNIFHDFIHKDFMKRMKFMRFEKITVFLLTKSLKMCY